MTIQEESIKKRNRKNDSTFNFLLSQTTRITQKLVKGNKSHMMVCFPKFWFEKWNNRNIRTEIRTDEILIHSAEDESNEKLIRIGGTHYIRLSNAIHEKLNYPKQLQLEFCGSYLILSVSDAEKDRIKMRMPEIEQRKKNEQMRQTYLRRI